MTTKDDIVIPRDELPEVVVTNHGNAHSFRLKKDVKNPTTRYKALEYIALDEAIKGHTAALEAKNAKAEDEKNLNKESLVLYCALHDLKSGEWGSGDDYAKKYWRNVARAARELHGK